VGISTKPFLHPFFGEKQEFGHILGTRDFELVFRGCEICSCDIEKEDAVQHPQIVCASLLSSLVGAV